MKLIYHCLFHLAKVSKVVYFILFSRFILLSILLCISLSGNTVNNRKIKWTVLFFSNGQNYNRNNIVVCDHLFFCLFINKILIFYVSCLIRHILVFFCLVFVIWNDYNLWNFFCFLVRWDNEKVYKIKWQKAIIKKTNLEKHEMVRGEKNHTRVASICYYLFVCCSFFIFIYLRINFASFRFICFFFFFFLPCIFYFSGVTRN